MFYGDVNTPLQNATVAMIFLDLKSFIIEKITYRKVPFNEDLEKGKNLTGQ